MLAASVTRFAPRVQTAQQVRNMSVISGPPQVKISGVEKAIHGLALTFGILAVPGWVLANIRKYRGEA